MSMNDDRIDEIFDHIEEVDVQLDEDPIRMGPNYLNNMVAKCRNHTTQIQKYKREVIQNKLQVERKLNRKKTEKELRFNDLMSNDERVKRRSSKSDREAKANNILQDLNSEIDELESELTDLKHVESIVESKLRELRDVNRDIRLQKRLIEDEIETGSFWGEDNTEDGHDQDMSQGDYDMSEFLEDEEEEADDADEVLGSDSDSEEDEEEEEYAFALDDIDTSAPDEDDIEDMASSAEVSAEEGPSKEEMTVRTDDGEEVDFDNLFD